MVATQQIECLADARQHAEAEHIDFENTQRIQVVLVPFDNRAVLHGGVLDRHHLAKGTVRHHHAARMLGQVAGKAPQFSGQPQPLAHRAVGGVETRLAQFGRADLIKGTAPDDGLQGDNGVIGKTKHLADFAHRTLGTIRDVRSGHTGPVAAVLGIDVLDDLFAPLVLEIDIDVGRLVARRADESLKQQINPFRIHRRNAKHVTHRRIGRRPSALAQDSAAAGKTDNVLDGKEVGGIIQVADNTQLIADTVADLVGQATRIDCRGAFPR